MFMAPFRQRPLGDGELTSFGDHDLTMEIVANGAARCSSLTVVEEKWGWLCELLLQCLYP